MQYSNYDMKNNVHATLSTAISSVATTIQLTAWQGARFWNTFPQIATLESFDENWKVVKREIVQITWRSGDNLTVVRAFAPCPENDDANSQSQNAISFNADDTISLYIPKEIFDIIKKSLNDIYDNGANNMRTEVVSWLQVEVNPWQVLVWSAYYDFAGWTITLTDNATNYLEVDEDGNLANNTTGRNDENTKLAIIMTSGGSVTSIKDRRLWTVWWKIGGVNIHDLTEKTTLASNDEFIIADSEAIFQNKKLKAKLLSRSNVWEVTNFKIITLWSQATITWTDPSPRIIPEPWFVKSVLVRKIWSAPTTPTDWTVIVEETTKNTYQTNWYIDTGLVDWNVYYYVIFTYSESWWISYCEPITAEKSRWPTSDTLLWYPLTENANDYSWNNRNWTATNAVFSNENGAFLVWNQTAWNNGSVSLPSMNIWWNSYNYTLNTWFKLWQSLTWNHVVEFQRLWWWWANLIRFFVGASWFNARPLASAPYVPYSLKEDKRYNITYVHAWLNITLYINWTQIWTWTLNYWDNSNSITNFGTATWDWADVWTDCYFKDYILESKAWLQTETQKYFDQHKSLYWY